MRLFKVSLLVAFTVGVLGLTPSVTSAAEPIKCNDGYEIPQVLVDKGVDPYAYCVDHGGYGTIVSPMLCDTSGTWFGIPKWYKYLNMVSDGRGGCKIETPASGPSGEDINKILPIGLALIEIMLRLVGFASVVFIIVGGVKYVISQGEPDKTHKAKDTIKNALIGVVIAVTATGIVSYVASTITS